MRDPLQYAIKNRRASVIDDAKLSGQPGGHPGAPALQSQEDASKGDLAPEVKEKDAMTGEVDGDENLDLQSAVLENGLNSPEHNPLARGSKVDEMGHEQLGQDDDVETHLLSGHELDPSRSPKTLGARVRAALGKKG